MCRLNNDSAMNSLLKGMRDETLIGLLHVVVKKNTNFSSFSLTEIIPNTATAQFCISEQHDDVSFLN